MNEKYNHSVVRGADVQGMATDRGESTEQNYDARRRALITGLAAVPVLLTLRSRSVFAQTPNTSCSIVDSVGLGAGGSQHPGITINNGDIARCDNPSNTNNTSSKPK